MNNQLFENNLVNLYQPGTGAVELWGGHNVRTVECRLCHKVIQVGHGFPFKSARLSHCSDGYICNDCIANILYAGCWTYNQFTGKMIPALMQSAYPIDGPIVAQAWLDHGMDGIIRTAKSVREAVIASLRKDVCVLTNRPEQKEDAACLPVI